MKWQKPQQYIDEQIKNPIQTIGAIAVAALLLSVVALFVAALKDK